MFSDRTEEKIFIGFQLIVLDNAIDDLRKIIHQFIEEKDNIEKPSDKKRFFQKISHLFNEIIFAAEYGYWDFKAHNKEAEEVFNTWIAEIEESSLNNFQVSDDENDISRISADKRYVSISIVMLFENTEEHNKISEKIEQIEEDKYFDKSTYIELLSYILQFNFEYLLGDAIFLVPGNDLDGLSWEDIHGEGWEYIKPIF